MSSKTKYFHGMVSVINGKYVATVGGSEVSDEAAKVDAAERAADFVRIFGTAAYSRNAETALRKMLKMLKSSKGEVYAVTNYTA